MTAFITSASEVTATPLVDLQHGMELVRQHLEAESARAAARKAIQDFIDEKTGEPGNWSYLDYDSDRSMLLVARITDVMPSSRVAMPTFGIGVTLR